MSPDLIAFLLDALPWLALAVTLGYLVGRFGYPPRDGRTPEVDEEGLYDTVPGAAHDSSQRDSLRAPLQRSVPEALTLRSHGARMPDANAVARQVERLSASCAVPPRAFGPRREPRSLH